jgi:hypothetical protein
MHTSLIAFAVSFLTPVNAKDFDGSHVSHQCLYHPAFYSYKILDGKTCLSIKSCRFFTVGLIPRTPLPTRA